MASWIAEMTQAVIFFPVCTAEHRMDPCRDGAVAAPGHRGPVLLTRIPPHGKAPGRTGCPGTAPCIPVILAEETPAMSGMEAVQELHLGPYAQVFKYQVNPA